MRTVFLKEFQTENYKLFLTQKIKNRKQGERESTVDFYYQILEWCHDVYENMAEEIIISYLYDGLRQDVMEVIYPQNPKTCAEFLKLARGMEEFKLIYMKGNRRGDQVGGDDVNRGRKPKNQY